MKTTNNSEFIDTLSVYAKKDKLELIENCYKQFGWVKVDSKDNAIYEDTADINFSRPYSMANKDDLQFLQVGMENKLNEIGKLEKTKHSKSTLLAITLGLGITALLILGLYLSFTYHTSWLLYLGAGLTLFSLICYLVLGKMTSILVKRENIIFEDRYSLIMAEIQSITKTARKLIGGTNEKTSNP